MSILSQAQCYTLATSVGLTSSSAQIAAAIAMAESGGNTAAINPGGGSDVEYSVGLWQINLLAHPQYSVTQMQDPTQNAKAMAVISGGGTSWGAWGTYTSGAYRQYMGNPVSYSTLPSSYNSIASPTTASTGSFFLGQTVSTNPATVSDVGSSWKYVLAYLVAILIFVAISRFQAGYNALYYIAVLFLMFLLVTQARFIANAVSPITQPSSTTSLTTV